MRHLSGRMLKPSLGDSFAARWTSSLEATHANRSAQQANASEPKTHVTSGPSSRRVSKSSGPTLASLKMLKGTFRWDSPQLLAIWKSWVTKCRGEYSLRLNAAMQRDDQLRIKGKEYLSWPTAAARDWKDTPGMAQTSINKDGSNRNRLDQLARAVYAYGLQDQTNRSKAGNRRERLNPRWTEVLMGIPIGWTAVSCTHPIVANVNFAASQSTQIVMTTIPNARALGRTAVTMNDYVSELQLLGNGVVPATAEVAIRTLFKELSNE